MLVFKDFVMFFISCSAVRVRFIHVMHVIFFGLVKFNGLIFATSFLTFYISVTFLGSAIVWLLYLYWRCCR